MFSTTIRFKDMSIRVDLHGMTVTCRNLLKKMNADQVAEFVYPLVDEIAKTLDKPADTPAKL